MEHYRAQVKPGLQAIGAVHPELSRREFLTLSAATAARAWMLIGASASPYTPAWTGAAAAAPVLDPAIVRRFGARFKGKVILPSDPPYDAARRIYNGRFNPRPALIAQCADTQDVVRAVDFARHNALTPCVRSGGHDYAGYSSCDGAMVIDLARMRAIHVGVRRRTAYVDSGVEVGQLYSALQAHGLTATSGTCPSVGVGGLTLGGGEGNLLCQYGLACDNVLSAHVVTADGRELTTNKEQHPDLFWAICGGGGNFGVVTRFEFRLFAVERVLRGEIAYPLSQCRDVLRRYREFVASAPDALTTGVLFGPSADKSFTIWFCYAGDLAEGERAATPLSRCGRPLHQLIQALRPTAALLEETEPAGTCMLATGGFLPHLSDALLEVICAHAHAAPPGFEVGMNDLRGAALRGDNAFPLRTPGFDTWIAAQWTQGRDSRAAMRWVRQLARDLGPFTRGVYVNRLHEEGEERARQAYGMNYERLAAIKGTYDPTNFFRMNQNIQPAIPG